MTSLSRFLQLALVLVLLAGLGTVLYMQAKPLLTEPCTEPIAYSLGELDTRFGISSEALLSALQEAEAEWEEAAGRDLFTYSEEGALSVNLIYSTQQQASELGEVISAEQSAYDAKKRELEELKTAYARVKSLYEALAEAYDKLSAEYHKQVTYWNSQGGAPEKEYEELNDMREELERRQERLKESAEDANDIANSLNARVDELNALAQKVNTKVDVYNQNAGDEFDQGDYQEDADGKRINVYEFGTAMDLKRVLAHEFGHALGIGHVENPSSIMYSFNAGSMLELSEEDVQALKDTCRLD